MLSPKQGDIKVYNDKKTDKVCGKSAVDVSKDLQKLMLRLKSEYLSADGHDVKYTELRRGPLVAQIEDQAVALRNVNLTTLTEPEKMAFFINVYNALTIHGLVARETLPASVLDVQQFWRKTAYQLGGHVYTLDDIEHGVLRGNRPHPGSKQPAFKDDDPRRQLVMTTVDPRLHFALNCGAKSCPAISVYSAATLDRALDAATRSFCDQEVKVYEMRKEIHVSPILQWYCGDFGKNDVEAIRWTLPYVSDEKRRILKTLIHTLETQGMVDIVYREYNWKLNTI